MSNDVELDGTDREILELLRVDARRTVSDIAAAGQLVGAGGKAPDRTLGIAAA